MNKKNKQYIILFVGVVVLVIIFAIVLFFTSGSKTSTITPSGSTEQNTTKNNMNYGASPSVTLPPSASNAQGAATQFYTYYFSSSKNPLANGAYKTNPYLSQTFKNIIATSYNNGNVPVFCPQNNATKITVSKEQQVPYNNESLTEVIISEVAPQQKDLDDVLLENTNGQWQIFDINCIP